MYKKITIFSKAKKNSENSGIIIYFSKSFKCLAW